VFFPAKAETYAEMAQFAQSICGDIPAGSLTRTNIQAKVQANAWLLAKIISGSGDVNASKQQEIYQGIPFDKLPDKIPTISMCKSELVKILIARKSEQGSVGQTITAPGGVAAGSISGSPITIKNSGSPPK
jgi:hypothetical protein